jgi:serine/threonine-protein kinase
VSKAAAPENLVGQLLDGRYKVIREIAVGGMSTVYEAIHVKIGRSVAIKVLHRELAGEADVVARFINEARTVGTIGHPNIVVSTDFGELAGRVPYQVLEYLSGLTVADEIGAHGPVTVQRTVRIAIQVASALEAAHMRGIVHRDLKSDNVFLIQSTNGHPDHVKVLDFGVSKFLFAPGSHPRTRRGITMGTPEFMAPEQISDPDTVDARTDIYALGVIMYHMLAGRTPFGRLPMRALLSQIILQAPPPIDRPGIPEGVRAVVLKSLAKVPQDRFSNMREMGLELQRFSSVSFPSEPQILGPRESSSSVATVLGAPPEGSAIFRAPTLPRAFATPKTAVKPVQVAPAVAHASSTRTPPIKRRAWWRPGHIGIAAAAAVAGALVVTLIAELTEPDPPSRPAAPAAAALVHPPVANVSSIPAAPAPAPPPPVAPPPARPESVRLEVSSPTPRARVTVRGKTHALPYVEELKPGSEPEIVELSASGYEGKRFWITFDHPITLAAELSPGHGTVEASAEEVPAQAAGAGTPRRTSGRSKPEAPEAAARTGEAAPTPASESAQASASPGESAPSHPPSLEKLEPAAPPAHEPTPAVAVSPPPPPPPPAPVAVKSHPVITPAVAPAPPPPAPPAPTAPRKPAAGTVDPVRTQTVVKDHFSEIQQCYDRGRMDDPELTGRVTVRINIAAGGTVTAAAVESSSLGDSRVEACIVNAVRGWKFPEPTGGAPATVSLPFNFH